MGLCFGSYFYDYAFCHFCPDHGEPRRTQGSTGGTGIQVDHLNAWYGTNQTLFDISLQIPAKRPRPSSDRPAAANPPSSGALTACMRLYPTVA